MREESNNQQFSVQAILDQVPNIDNNNNDSSIFSPLIPLTILLISYPIWNSFEEEMGIKNISSSFFLSNFIFIFTVILSLLIFKFGPKLININDPALLDKWEENNPEVQRIYWMNPLDLREYHTLGGKLIDLILNSLMVGFTIIFSSISIAILFIFMTFDSNIPLELVLFIPLALSVMWGQLYFMFDEIHGATGIYLHKDKVVIRSALIFRSLPSLSYKIKNLKKIHVKEIDSFQYDIPLFHLKFKKNRFIDKTIAKSDDYVKMRELKSKIENYINHDNSLSIDDGNS